MSYDDLIAQALDNLVNQFANPMDFLRELVQNSIDAGSPRIEVELRFRGDGARGVAEVEVRDFGGGMDEDVIDAQLTRLFASAKQGDRTAIGKFGIGFTSVFAIRPQAVRVLTGRHGEAWEVVFHEDRSFEKRPLDRPVAGTTITLYRRMRASKVAELVEDARRSLVFWCEHAETPIRFIDATAGGPAEVAATGEDDVFGAFAAAADDGVINRPFELEHAAIQARHEDGGVVAVVGVEDEPRWCFFSGGLTLLRSTDPGHLGPYEAQLRHVSFKILSRAVGHTLTRDNVIQDDAWRLAMRVAGDAVAQLRRLVLERVEALLEQPAGDPALDAELERWQRWLADDHGRAPLPDGAPMLRDGAGQAMTLGALRSRTSRLEREVWVLRADEQALGQAMVAAGLPTACHTDSTLDLLRAALPGSPIYEAADVYCLCTPVEAEQLDAPVAALLAATDAQVARATAGSLRVGASDLGPRSPMLYVEGRGHRGLYRMPTPSALASVARAGIGRLFAQLRGRWLLVNRAHPYVQALAARADVDLAAYALAQALLVADPTAGRSAVHRLRHAGVRRWVTDGA